MTTENDAIKAVNTLKQFCKEQRCDTCLFMGGQCAFWKRSPTNWVVPKSKRWSDADVALAKALIKNGYETIFPANDFVIGIAGNSREVSTIYIEKGVLFKSYIAGEIVELKDIVNEKVVTMCDERGSNRDS